MADIDTNPRYRYVKKLADSAAERARKLHLEYQNLDCEATEHARCMRNLLAQEARVKAQGKLNDFFYWIGHANAYRGIALQIDFMETVEMDEDEEPSCP